MNSNHRKVDSLITYYEKLCQKSNFFSGYPAKIPISENYQHLLLQICLIRHTLNSLTYTALEIHTFSTLNYSSNALINSHPTQIFTPSKLTVNPSLTNLILFIIFQLESTLSSILK